MSEELGFEYLRELISEMQMTLKRHEAILSSHQTEIRDSDKEIRTFQNGITNYWQEFQRSQKALLDAYSSMMKDIMGTVLLRIFDPSALIRENIELKQRVETLELTLKLMRKDLKTMLGDKSHTEQEG